MNVRDAKQQLENWAIELESPIELQQSGWLHDSRAAGRRDPCRGHQRPQRQPSALGAQHHADRHGPAGAEHHRHRAAEGAGRTAHAALAGRQAASRTAAGGTAGYWAYPSATVLVEDGVTVGMDESTGSSRTSPTPPRSRRCSRGRSALYIERQRRFLQDDPGYLNCKPPGGAASVPAALRRAVRRGPRAPAHFRADRRRQSQLPHHLPGWPRATPARSAATTTIRSTTAGRRPVGRRHARRRDDGASTRTSGSPTAGCRTRTSCRSSERFTRPDFDTLRYEVTVDDPGAYTQALVERLDSALGRRRRVAEHISVRTTVREAR